MRHELGAIVAARLRADRDALQHEFAQPGRIGTRAAIVDHVLPVDVATRIFHAMPPNESMRLLSSFRERKFTSKALDRMDPLVADATFAFQSPDVIAEVAAITGFRDMHGDPQLYAGGISAMTRGQFLNPHVDNSHDGARRNYRVVNVLYYVTPDWRPENGGNLELWDDNVRERREIPSLFNRLVIMETNHHSWHSVNEVRVDGRRCCVSNYYFSPHPPTGKDVFHVTFFRGRPERPLQRLVTAIDSHARTWVRRVIKGGLAKRDVYTGKPTAP